MKDFRKPAPFAVLTAGVILTLGLGPEVGILYTGVAMVMVFIDIVRAKNMYNAVQMANKWFALFVFVSIHGTMRYMPLFSQASPVWAIVLPGIAMAVVLFMAPKRPTS